MPARASRRSGGEQNVELLNAIIAKLTQNNPAQYDELLNGWEVIRQAALDAQNEGTALHIRQVAELASREAVLAWRTERMKRFVALVMDGYSAIIRDDRPLGEVDAEIAALMAEQPPVAATVQ